MALYKFFSQDGATVYTPKEITCELSTLTKKDLMKANAKVKRSIERAAAESTSPNNGVYVLLYM